MKSKTASFYLCTLTCIILAIGLTATGCKKQEEITTIKLNEVVHSIFYAPQYVALEKGFFEEEGLKIELSVGQGADKSMTALVSKDADIALLGTEAGIYVYNEGKENYAKSFAQLTQRAGNYLVSRTNDKDFSWEQVRGKEIIGGRVGGMPQMILEYVLNKNGIIPGKDVEIVTNLQFTSTAGAFAGGVGDYTAEFDPSALSLEQAGHGYVVSALGKESGYVPYTVYMATKEYIDKNPQIIQKFTNAIYKGQLWVKNHSAKEIAEVIKPHFPDNDIASLEIMINRYNEQNAWKDNPTFDKDGFELIQEVMKQSNMLSKQVPFDDLINNKFAEEAIKKVK